MVLGRVHRDWHRYAARAPLPLFAGLGGKRGRATVFFVTVLTSLRPALPASMPPRERPRYAGPAEPAVESVANPFLRWIDRALSR